MERFIAKSTYQRQLCSSGETIMKFKKELLQELAYECYVDGFEVIEQKMTGHTRWSLKYSMIFKFEDKLYKTSYSTGATEYQDEEPYEYEDDVIECPEVFPVEKTIIVYEAKR
jgi:hypothetical protein